VNKLSHERAGLRGRLGWFNDDAVTSGNGANLPRKRVAQWHASI
jgi:hypothetical protein